MSQENASLKALKWVLGSALALALGGCAGLVQGLIAFGEAAQR